MALTIDDIYDKEFALKGGGYDRNDVDQFLDEICDEMTSMMEHMQDLEKQLQQSRMETQAARAAEQSAKKAAEEAAAAAPVVKENTAARATSQTLEGILLSAQRLADEAVAKANMDAESIVKDAQEKATMIVDEARAEKKQLSGELEALQTSVAKCKEGFLTMLNKYKTLLEKETFMAE